MTLLCAVIGSLMRFALAPVLNSNVTSDRPVSLGVIMTVQRPVHIATSSLAQWYTHTVNGIIFIMK